MRLEDYQKLLEGKRCRWCGCDLSDQEVKHYPHKAGWEVEGFEEKQWLYVVCPCCNYQWALWKLGIPR